MSQNIDPAHDRTHAGEGTSKYPPGVVEVGVTKAVKAMDVFHLSQDEAKVLFGQVSAACLEELRVNVKGARPIGEFGIQVNGPLDDPLQGRIFGVSVYAPFRLDDLDADSVAWQAHTGGGGSR